MKDTIKNPFLIAVKSISSFFRSFRPSFTFDPITGSPTVSLNIPPEQANAGLQEIFEYLKASGKQKTSDGCHVFVCKPSILPEHTKK